MDCYAVADEVHVRECAVCVLVEIEANFLSMAVLLSVPSKVGKFRNYFHNSQRVYNMVAFAVWLFYP